MSTWQGQGLEAVHRCLPAVTLFPHPRKMGRDRLRGEGDRLPQASLLRRAGCTRSPFIPKLMEAGRIFGFLFLGSAGPMCLESADADNSGSEDISEGVYLLGHLFLNPVSPPPPGFTEAPCGADPDVPGAAGDLGCLEYPACAP